MIPPLILLALFTIRLYAAGHINILAELSSPTTLNRVLDPRSNLGEIERSVYYQSIPHLILKTARDGDSKTLKRILNRKNLVMWNGEKTPLTSHVDFTTNILSVADVVSITDIILDASRNKINPYSKEIQNIFANFIMKFKTSFVSFDEGPSNFNILCERLLEYFAQENNIQAMENLLIMIRNPEKNIILSGKEVAMISLKKDHLPFMHQLFNMGYSWTQYIFDQIFLASCFLQDERFISLLSKQVHYLEGKADYIPDLSVLIFHGNVDVFHFVKDIALKQNKLDETTLQELNSLMNSKLKDEEALFLSKFKKYLKITDDLVRIAADMQDHSLLEFLYPLAEPELKESIVEVSTRIGDIKMLDYYISIDKDVCFTWVIEYASMHDRIDVLKFLQDKWYLYLNDKNIQSGLVESLVWSKFETIHYYLDTYPHAVIPIRAFADYLQNKEYHRSTLIMVDLSYNRQVVQHLKELKDLLNLKDVMIDCLEFDKQALQTLFVNPNTRSLISKQNVIALLNLIYQHDDLLGLHLMLSTPQFNSFLSDEEMEEYFEKIRSSEKSKMNNLMHHVDYTRKRVSLERHNSNSEPRKRLRLSLPHE